MPGSLRYVQTEISTAMSKISQPGIHELLGAMLDDVRGFTDKWSGLENPRGGVMEERHVTFFQDLGTLRERVRLWGEGFAMFEPKAKITTSK